MSQSRPYRGRGGNPYNGRGNWRGRGGYYGNSRGGYRGNNTGRGGYYGNNRGRNSNYDSNSRGGGNRNANQSRVRQATLDEFSPYKGWKLYFPNEAYTDMSPTVKIVQVFEKYYVSWQSTYDAQDLETKRYILLDFKELLVDKVISEGLPNLETDMKSSPEKMINSAGLAIHQFVQARITQELSEDPLQESEYFVPKIHARFLNFGPVTPLKNLKANYYGKFIAVKGTVVRVSNIKPMCIKMAFQCNSCSNVQSCPLPDGKFILPTKCISEGCRGKSFIPLRGSSLTVTVDWQTIRLQEIMNEDQHESGRIPRTVDCELTSDLVDSCVPGDVVTISGVVKVSSIDEGRSRNKDKCMFLLYVDANSVNNQKGQKKNGESDSGLAIDFSIKELYAIEEIQSEPNLFRLIVGSLCPSIYGHELVKAGLALGLFGGSQKYANDKNRISVRGDPHILVVGDPGLGKSQMLQAVTNVAPRSVYVCGNTTTSSGLTVTLCKEGSSRDHALEAGALVLADQGCCCIDEFDKMGNQHQALLEAMEQQSISIAKAGIVCSLPARTSILAAANPVGGHYNKAKTVSENLKMGSALLSRFDLVFILLDKPDEEMDSMLSEHVMALHGGRKKAVTSATVTRDASMDESRLLWEADRPLSERLKVPPGDNLDTIPAILLRKYVGYARKYVHPKIGPEAAKILQDFYLDLRKNHQTPNSTPITTRQLESLIRLTEARARLELREIATEQDAQDVVEIMKYSMIDVYSDEHGILDFRRSQLGSGMSGRSRPKKFIAALQRISDNSYNSIFTIQQMYQIAKDIGMSCLNFQDFIDSLNNQGFLLKKGSKVYQLQTAGF